jgi:transcriptional regulator with XRE-family HTH domain
VGVDDVDREVNDILVSIGVRLRGLREKHGWTQHGAAHRAGITSRHLQRIENGSNVSVATLYRVATAYGVTVKELFG